MAASPTCEVKNGAAAYVTAVGGVDLTVGATIIIRLASTVDVDAWAIDCVTTDDSSVAATVTADLVIDATLRTATFTAPAAGKTYRFRSRINSGIDRNGVAQPSYSTTFCLYTVKNGRRKWASDETTEGNSTFGYITQFNDLIDSVPSGSGDWGTGGGGGGVFQLFGVSNHFLQYQGGSAVGATGMNYVPTAGTVEFNRGLRVIGTAVATLANAMLVSGTGATGFRAVAPFFEGAMVTGVATLASVMIAAGTGATGFNLVAPIMQGSRVTGVATMATAVITDSVSIGGATVSDTGSVRLPNGAGSVIAAAAGGGGTQKIYMASVSSGDALHIGANPSQSVANLGNVFYFAGAGSVHQVLIGGVEKFTMATNGMQIGAGAQDFGGGVGVVGIDNATTVPSTNPTAGGILYVASGGLHYRGASGTVTVIGAP